MYGSSNISRVPREVQYEGDRFSQEHQENDFSLFGCKEQYVQAKNKVEDISSVNCFINSGQDSSSEGKSESDDAIMDFLLPDDHPLLGKRHLHRSASSKSR